MVEYEKRYREVKRHRLDLPIGVQAFFLLQAANLTLDLEKLVRATATLVYSDMKEKIQKVLSDSCGKESGGVPVKRMSVTTQIEKVITRKEAVTR